MWWVMPTGGRRALTLTFLPSGLIWGTGQATASSKPIHEWDPPHISMASTEQTGPHYGPYCSPGSRNPENFYSRSGERGRASGMFHTLDGEPRTRS